MPTYLMPAIVNKGQVYMGLMDGVLLTLINGAICIALPKLLSIMLAEKAQQKVPSQPKVTAQKSSTKIPSFSS
jgi:hypothetical protein